MSGIEAASPVVDVGAGQSGSCSSQRTLWESPSPWVLWGNQDDSAAALLIAGFA